MVNRVIKEVGLIVPYKTLLQVYLSARVTGDGSFRGLKLEILLGLLVMWIVTPQSMTH